MNAIEILEAEVQRRIEPSGFPKEQGLELVALHEESLARLHRGDFETCAARCRKRIGHVPTFGSARDNLALANFHLGRRDEAVSFVEETVSVMPENRIAQAMLAKMCFLNGRQDDLDREEGQAPWPCSLEKWIPKATFEEMARALTRGPRVQLRSPTIDSFASSRTKTEGPCDS